MVDLISVIVTTFDREDALDSVLRSLSRQIDRQFEVVVADDGSGPATASVVARWQSRIGVKLAHVRHEHRGFRAAEIRNKAIGLSAGGYCIFLDGDCIAPLNFVSVHRKLSECGWFVAGNRALLSRVATQAVLEKGLEPECWDFAAWAGVWLKGRVNRLDPLLRLPGGAARKWRPQSWKDARSCNLGVWRTDLERVDGFDGSFAGWGREDSDLLIRLLRAGVRRKDGNYATGVIHLWHAEADRGGLIENEKRLDDVLASNRISANRGLSHLKIGGKPTPADRIPENCARQ